MAYSKQTWVTGETITASKLNHIEDGIEAVSANGAIGTANLADGAVTAAKLDESATDIIADTFSTSAAYSAGDYVIYSGALYRFTADKTAGLWDASKVRQISVAEAHSELSDDVNEFESHVLNSYKVTNDFVYGRYLSGGFANVTTYARNNKAYPAGTYDVGPNLANKSFIVVAYISDTQGQSIYGNWINQKVRVVSDKPFYITFNGITGDTDIAAINSGMSVVRILSGGETLETRVASAEEQAQDAAENFASVYSKNRYDGEYTVGGYVTPTTGEIGANSGHAYSSWVDISNHGTSNVVISNTHNSQIGYTNLRYAFYKADKTFISGDIAPTLQNDASLNRDYAVITTPTNAAFMRFSLPNAGFTLATDWQIEYGEVTEYSVYTGDYSGIKTDSIKENKLVEKLSSMTYGVKPSQATADTLTDGQTLVVENNSVMKNQVISFFAKIDGAFSGVFVGHGKQSYGYYIKVDDTNMSYCSNGSIGTAVPHGLTISEFFCVTVEVDVDLNVKVTIATAGGTFTKTAQINSSWRGDIFAESIETTFDNAVLTWDSPDYKCPFWAFGDSYFTLYTATRWTYYVAKQWGFDNILLDAYPGENSEAGYNDFVNALTHGKPKYVLWCLGMNDPDGASTVNATWLAKAKAVKELCTANEIELIYATIPETTASGTKNTLKNAWIRDSGVRYVDFAAALSDVTGWLSDDGVHPSEIGGRFMAAYLMASVPEIMQK